MSASVARPQGARLSTTLRTRGARAMLVVALVAGAGAGLLIGAHARTGAGDLELTHLLRAMAMLKLLFVAAAASAIWWRLQAPITPYRLSAYAGSCLAMAMGPGLIWYLAYIGPASVLLHGGAAVAAVLLWRDPASSHLLDAAICKRRRIAH
ncbi:MAG: hypothetical protein RQ966_18015 [Acetobacteraceae bacterium]|nr:hypothetical protein [Acetobacteraceae bacterium]